MSENKTTKTENEHLQGGQLDNLVMRLEIAWTELQSFGNHAGECTFDGICPTCGTKQGRCNLHAEVMNRRLLKMNTAVAILREFSGRITTTSTDQKAVET